MTRTGGAFVRIVFCLVISLTITANAFPDTTGKKHRKTLPRPILLGVSGGNNEDETASFCCSGTLGSLVEDSTGTRFILSNNHVFGLVNKGDKGDPIGQPGLIEVNCDDSLAEPVALLSKIVKFEFKGKDNKIDASIAEVLPGAVNDTGDILDIGIPGQPEELALGTKVKKSGRTTGKTKGKVIGLDVTVEVDFETKCGSSKTKTAKFIEQAIIQPRKPSKPFVLGGDSGSLVVKNTKTCPAAVGLLFAGDDAGVAAINLIQNVLDELDVSVVGCAAPAAATRGFKELSMQDPRLLAAKSIKDQHEEQLFRIPGVVGAGLGLSKEDSNELAILVFVKKGSRAATAPGMVPARLGNMPVRILATSGFKAM